MNIRYASLTDVGVKRSHNQDACATQPASDAAVWEAQGHVFIVADGMGGHAVGEKASAKAVRDIPLTYLKHVATEGVHPAIVRAFTEANASIYAIGQNNPEFKGLGTTATALFLRPEGIWVGHVGDSRAYRIRGARVQQLTFDHSWVWEVARRQGIDPDELGDFKKNVIIRSLGPDATVEVDVEGPHPTEPGDVYLLCSDGLSNVVTPDEIGAVTALFGPDEACQHLVSLANIRGGPDNITCLLVQIPDGAGSSRAGGSMVAKLAKKFAKRINRVVPWPFLMLAIGAIVAVASVWLKSEQLPGAVPSFVLAAILILGGLAGLYTYLRNRTDEPEAMSPPTTPELRLYRDYTFDIGPLIVDRFAMLGAGLKDAVKDRDITIDWVTHDRFIAEADAATQRSDWAVAFKARFLAVQTIAAAVNKSRQKEEVFQPNWTTPTRA